MSRFVFDPMTNELQRSIPREATIPSSAFRLNSSTVIVEPCLRRTPTVLIILVVVIITLIVIVLLYFIWWNFIRDDPLSTQN